MFEQGFAALFRAVDRIRGQFLSADEDLRTHLTEELLSIQQLSERYIDYWMTLDEQIIDLLETYAIETPVPNLAPSPVKTTTKSFDNPTKSEAEVRPELPYSRTDFDIHPANFAIDGTDGSEWYGDDSVPLAFRKGLAYYDLFLYDQAAQQFTETLVDTDSVVARLYLASCYVQNQQDEQALTEIKFIQNGTKDALYLAAANELEGLIYVKLGQLDEAAAALEQVTQSLSRYPHGWFNLGCCQFARGYLQDAKQALQNAIEIHPDDIEAWAVLGHVCLRLHAYDEAKIACQQGLSRNPMNDQLLLLKAILYRQNGDWEACLDTCKSLYKHNPNCTTAWYLGSWCCVKLNRYEAAAAVLKQRMCLVPSDGDALIQLGMVYTMAGWNEEAEKLLLRSFPRAVEKSMLWIALGRVSIQRGDWTQAHARFLRAMKDTRKSVRRLAMYLYGQGLLNSGRVVEAETYFKGASVLGPPNEALYHALGECAEQQGREHEAERWFQQADKAKHTHSALTTPSETR